MSFTKTSFCFWATNSIGYFTNRKTFSTYSNSGGSIVEEVPESGYITYTQFVFQYRFDMKILSKIYVCIFYYGDMF